MTIDLATLGPVAIVAAHTLVDADLHATNTLDDPERVGLSPNATASIADGILTIELPPVSWTALELSA